ncbi:hypothetical protein [Nostoc sp.]|uniref:hypothetical protein n=1 Tax=Nostoc sp. TaxID=1180 RepID=UPI002FF89B90
MAGINRARVKRKRRYPTAGKSRLSGGLDWNARYGDPKKYRKQVAIAHKRTHQLCCNCLVRPSKELHHIRYSDERGLIAGREKIGHDIVPVCLQCHERVHKQDAWYKDSFDPIKNNCNFPYWAERLRLGYQLLYGGVIW